MSTTQITLRQDQSDLVSRYLAIKGSNVLIVAPTGFGKTVVMGRIASILDEPSVAIAHRHELVSQISRAIARFGVRHNVIASDATVSFCIQQQIRLFGRSFVDPRAPFTVAGVDTVRSRAGALTQWANAIRYWMIDEAHHTLANNKWGLATGMFPRATGIGFTATPIRADGRSLARSQGGVFDEMLIGPGMRDLIDRGSLCDYRIFAPPVTFDRAAIKIGSTGDFSGPSMRKEVHESKIVGDMVAHYQRIASGKRGITFVVDVDHAVKTAAAYRAAGVPAECVSAKTPDAVRDAVMAKFVEGKILQLVNVDLFGEGVDVPAVEVVSMGRPTESYGLYVQQFGRALRVSEGKTHGIIIDHVGNVVRHGLPDAPRKWSLTAEQGGRKAKRDPNAIPVRVCAECLLAYEATRKDCPECGYAPKPSSRSGPEFVDGDLHELDPEVLAQMRAAVERIDAPCPVDPVDPRSGAIAKNWHLRQDAQRDLRDSISRWAGILHHQGKEDSEIYRRFYHAFGTDVLSAQTLSASDALKLREQIDDHIADV